MLLGLLGILAGLEFPIWLSYRGWSVLLLAPAAELVAAAASGEPLLAHWTETFMGGAAKFLAQFFPLFLLGALFGKLMDDSGSVEVTEKFGTARGILAVALAGAIVTYGGVSLFVAFFVLVPMAQSLFKAADIPAGWCLRLASEHGIDPALRHRVAVMSAGTLDSLPHNGAVVTLLAVCSVTHRDSYKDIFVVAIVGALLALAGVIVLGSIFGSF
jgi:H+/gluconate symporter-like permease